MNDVDAVIDTDPEKQRKNDHVCGIERNIQVPHDAECAQHPDEDRTHCQDCIGKFPKIQHQKQKNCRQCVNCRILVPFFHLQRALVRLKRIPRDFGIDGTHVSRELLQILHFPKIFLGVDLQEKHSVRVHSVNVGFREVRERRRFQGGHPRQNIEFRQQILSQRFLVLRHPPEIIGQFHPAKLFLERDDPLIVRREFLFSHEAQSGSLKTLVEFSSVFFRQIRTFRTHRRLSHGLVDLAHERILFHHRRDLLHMIHTFQRLKFFDPLLKDFRVIRHGDRIPEALLAFFDQPHFHLDAFQTFRLKVKQIVVVV